MRRRPDFFRGKTIVVTGATRGIGRALCQQLLAQGAQVIGVARNQAQLTARRGCSHGFGASCR